MFVSAFYVFQRHGFDHHRSAYASFPFADDGSSYGNWHKRPVVRCQVKFTSVVAGHRTVWLVVQPRRGLHIEQRTYDVSIGTGFLELSVILFSPEIFTSNATSEIATPSEHDAITCTFEPSSCDDLIVHF
jgi:hypothetical protein